MENNYQTFLWRFYLCRNNERKSSSIPHSPTLRERAAPDKCQCHTLVVDIRTENHNRILVIIGNTWSITCNNWHICVTFWTFSHCQKHIQTVFLSLIFACIGAKPVSHNLHKIIYYYSFRFMFSKTKSNQNFLWICTSTQYVHSNYTVKWNYVKRFQRSCDDMFQ